MGLLNLFREPKHIMLKNKCCYCDSIIDESSGIVCDKCDDLEYLSSRYRNYGTIPNKIQKKADALINISDNISKEVFIQKRDEILEEWAKYKKKKEETDLRKNLKLLGLRK